MFTFERKANYYETDQMGIVHHSNYIRWFEEARLEMLRAMGLPYKEMEDNGILIPVLGVSCSYKHPIRFDETLVLTLRIQNYNGVRFEMAYEGHSKETGLLSCTGTSQHCFTTPALKPIRMQKHFPAWHEVFLQAAEPGQSRVIQNTKMPAGLTDVIGKPGGHFYKSLVFIHVAKHRSGSGLPP